MHRSFRIRVGFVAAVTLCSTGTLLAQGHPSGIANRVLIAVQNPSGNFAGATVIVPQFALQIGDATNNGYPNNVPPLISGVGSSLPASLENLSAEGYGLVNNEDGTASIIDYATETLVSRYVGITTPTAGALLSQSLRYVFVANEQGGQLTVLDRQSIFPAVNLSLPGIINVSTNPGATVVMAFAQDSNIVYYLLHLSGTDQQLYAGGNWPTNAQDCEPFAVPTFCLMKVTSVGTPVATYSQANFDHPVKAVSSAPSATMYVLNGGPEADGTTASVTVLPVAPMFLEDGSQTGTIPASPVSYPIPGGADDAIVLSSTLYVAGQGKISPGLWAGQLTTVNTLTGSISAPMPMADGTPVRMALGDDNTLWIGSIRCNTGDNFYNYKTQGLKSPYGCLTVVNLQSQSVVWVEPWYCQVDTSTICAAGDFPSNYIYGGIGGTSIGGSGDVTGIAPIIGQHKVFYVEHGQIHIRSTLPPFGITSNSGITVSGVAVDIVYMDQGTDTDGTYTSTTH